MAKHAVSDVVALVCLHKLELVWKDSGEMNKLRHQEEECKPHRASDSPAPGHRSFTPRSANKVIIPSKAEEA